MAQECGDSVGMMSDYRKNLVKCNVNDAIRFTLGEKGIARMLEVYGCDYMDHVHPGWKTPGTVLEMQLWQFMQVMGPITRLGMNGDSKTTIELKVYRSNMEEALKNG